MWTAHGLMDGQMERRTDVRTNIFIYLYSNYKPTHLDGRHNKYFMTYHMAYLIDVKLVDYGVKT